MKRIFSILLSALLVLSLLPVAAFAAEENDISIFEFPAPKAPNYFVYTDGNASEGHHDDLRMIMVADPEVALLAAEYYADSDTFYEKYGLWSFAIAMQYDVSLDDEAHWQHNAEWDTNWYTSGYADGYPYVSLGSEMMEDFEFFWLTYHEGQGSGTFTPYQPAIISETYYYSDGYQEEIYSFDVENHSLYIRCRYYMEWEPLVENEYGWGPGEKQSKFSDWSESAIFGKNSTQIIPEEPTTYEAPIISDLKIVLSEGDENSHLEYVQTTPESVWMANVYYYMTGDGELDGLETQVSINGGEWVEFDTADSWGDWCLRNGSRGAYNFDVPIEENSHVKLRIRFNGTHGPSPWSNVLEANGGGVSRQEGANRYDTAFLAADRLKEELGVEQFDTIVVASGTQFPDALSGSYLCAVKNAPMLLARENKNTLELVKDYIRENLKPGGTVYILGGVNAVPKAMETGLEEFTVKRLGGADRYATNLLILEEAGVEGKDVLVCTGKGFADSLSAAAAKQPILLVKDNLTAAQKEFLQGTTGKKYVIGGTAAVNSRIESALGAYGQVIRLGGATRYETSVLVARTFFDRPESLVLAYALNFPDGLSGGALAAGMNVPLILTADGKEKPAAAYAQEMQIAGGYVLGGSGLISDKTVEVIFWNGK